jgi:hypothetical protein
VPKNTKSKTNGGATGTALTKYDARLAELARASKEAVSGVGGGGNFISLKGGMLSFQQAVIPGNVMKVIVVDWTLENQFYEGSYDPENSQAPSCYAFGRDAKAMAPNPEYVEVPIAASCADCPNHEWGSAETGKGKACKEVARLGLIAESDFENIEKAVLAYLKVPVTSMKYWAGYLRQLDEVYHRPALAFVTEIAIVKENTNKLPGWHVEFTLSEKIEDEAGLAALLKRYDEISKTITFPYPKFEEAAAEETPAPRRAAPKKAGRAAAVAAPAALPAGRTKIGARKAVAAPKF